MVFKRKLFVFKIIQFFFKIDNITPDPDLNWAKILDPYPNSKFWIHNTERSRAGSVHNRKLLASDLLNYLIFCFV